MVRIDLRPDIQDYLRNQIMTEWFFKDSIAFLVLTASVCGTMIVMWAF